MISVITATYNHAPFLLGAIASLQAQTFQDWEHIIIDDGSTDATAEVLAKALSTYGGAKFRIFKTENRGVTAALNLGLSKARGEWVAFLDSDDEYLPNHLSLMMETIGDRDFAVGRFILNNCSSSPKPTVHDFYQPRKEIEVEKIEIITGVLFGRKEAFAQVGHFRPVIAADTDLFNRMQQTNYRWNKAAEPSYLYFFGRVPNSKAIRDASHARRAFFEETRRIFR